MIRYVVIAAIGAILLAILFAMPHEKFSLKSKIFTTISVLLLLIFAGIFESFNAKEASLRRDLLLKFEQGEEIKCGKFIVNAKKFNYEYGTASFIAKDKIHGGDETLSGVSIDIQTCGDKSEK